MGPKQFQLYDLLEEVNTNEALGGVVDIDNDNELAPENVPAAADNSNRLLSTEWAKTGFVSERVRILEVLRQN